MLKDQITFPCETRWPYNTYLIAGDLYPQIRLGSIEYDIMLSIYYYKTIIHNSANRLILC